MLRPPWLVGPRDQEVMMGLYFDPSTWDGSDVFTYNGRHVFVTERAKNAVQEIGGTNFRFTALDRLENHRATLQLRRTETRGSDSD